MANKIFNVKPVDLLIRESNANKDLKRTLTASNLVALGVGAIIGAGIFVLTGTVAAQHSGPAIVFSFVIAGIVCAFSGLCYAEFSSMIPIAGSAYTYAYSTMGEFFAWVIGWDLILEYLFGASTVAVGWSGYVNSFLRGFGINLPQEIMSPPITYGDAGFEVTGAFVNLPAMLIIALMTGLLIVGIHESAKVNNIIVILKVVVILAFIAIGFAYINMDNYSPFIPENTGTFGEFGWSGILRGAGVIFFAYIGFDAVSTAAQEAKNPQRDMPRGILGSLMVTTVLYILVALVLTGVVSYTLLDVPDPIAVGIDEMGKTSSKGFISFFQIVIKFGAIAGLTSVILVMLMAQPRIFYTMGRDGLLPPAFARVHPKFKTPYVPTLITGSIAALLAGLFPIGILGEMVSIGTLLAFAMVCIGVVVLRKTRPDLPRPFKTPLSPWLPLAGALGAGGVMLTLPVDTWFRLIIWMAIGLAIYFFYGRHHSRLNFPEKHQGETIEEADFGDGPMH
ncbi:MAG: amino acid permease [Bacteroidia bacterium]|nr:amino acid permease [Bacteroidia bacterium]